MSSSVASSPAPAPSGLTVGGAIGLELQRALPESYTTGGPKDMTGAVVGLMTLLLALVLGLLIWTAYGVFSTQKASVQTLAITDLKLDGALQDYGPEAAEGHRILREGIKNTIAQIWGDSDADDETVIHKYGYARAYLKARIALFEHASACVGPTDSGKSGCDPSRDRHRPDTHADDARSGRSISYSLISIVVDLHSNLRLGPIWVKVALRLRLARRSVSI